MRKKQLATKERIKRIKEAIDFMEQTVDFRSTVIEDYKKQLKALQKTQALEQARIKVLKQKRKNGLRKCTSNKRGEKSKI